MSLRGRLVARWMALERRVANPAVAAILRSPLHSLLSWRLLLLAYEGTRSGRYYETPVLYRERDGRVVLVTPGAATNWWRNFEGGHPVSILLRGEWRDGVGEVVIDEDAALEHLRWLVAPVRRASRVVLGRSLPSDDWLQQAAAAVVLVVLTLEDSETELEASDRSSA